MTLVFKRPVSGPAVHAMVVGVGTYPYVDSDYANEDIPGALLGLGDLPNAVAGARLFADFLLRFADALPAPLASIELLMSDPGPPEAGSTFSPPSDTIGSLHDPRDNDLVEPAREQLTEAAGARWRDRLTEGPNKNFAVFYVCGHGAALPAHNFVFLEDLGSKNPRWEPLLDLRALAAALNRTANVDNAYLIADACQVVVDALLPMFVPGYVESPRPLRLIPVNERHPLIFKTLLIVPGPMGSTTFADGNDAGRFTQLLVEALSGAAARNNSGQGDWSVMVDTLPRAIRHLAEIRWPDGAMNPQPAVPLVSDTPLVSFSNGAPEVPFRIRFDPSDGIIASKIWIDDPKGKELIVKACQAEVWTAKVQAQMGICMINSIFSQELSNLKSEPTVLDLSEMRVNPGTTHKILLP